MDTQIFIVSAVIAGGFAILIWQQRSSLDKNSDSVQRQLNEVNRTLNDRLDNAAQMMSGVAKSIGEMSEVGRSLRQLQDLLASPKLRGNLGETLLTNLLQEMLPKEKFHLQYRFRNGQIVDAAVETDAGIIPIDAKFPMENFNKMVKSQSEDEHEQARKLFIRDVKKHVDDVAQKYILPQENTMGYALLHIPTDSVAFEILSNNPELYNYARSKKVSFSSPSFLPFYLRTILESYRGKEIQEGIKEIMTALEAIQQQTNIFSKYLDVMMRHVKNAFSSSEDVVQHFARLSSKISSVDQIKGKTNKKISA